MKWVILGNKIVLSTVIVLAFTGAITMWWFGGGFSLSFGEQMAAQIFGAILGAGIGVILGVWGLGICRAIRGDDVARVKLGVVIGGAIVGALFFWSIAGGLATAIVGAVIGIYGALKLMWFWDLGNRM